MTEDFGSSFHKGITEWWSEESEYIFQRIERWTILARGYNKLRSERCRGRGRSPDETRRINCCGTFNYQSNTRIDSTCLETYRYDHSIYFKTIGDIKGSKSKESNLSEYCNNEQLDLSLRVSAKSPPTNNENNNTSVVTADGDVHWDYLDEDHDDPELEKIFRNVWPIVDLTNLTAEQTENDSNNNVIELPNLNNLNKDQEHRGGILSLHKTRKSTKVKQPMVYGENNVAWPGVLLSYNNMDPALVSSQRAVNVK